VPADSFVRFAEPGWVKTAVNFHAVRDGDHALLSTEARILATNAAARRSFRRYWRVIYPGSAAIRIAWLRTIRRRAQPASASSSRSTSSSVV
jgi:hypothetical protein